MVRSRCFPVYWVKADRPCLDQHFGARVELRDRIVLDQLVWLLWPFQQENGLGFGDCDWCHRGRRDGVTRVCEPDGRCLSFLPRKLSKY